MTGMDRFDDVSVVASVDESPPPPRVPRGVRRTFAAVVASVVVVGALAGAAVGLADEKSEPSPSATRNAESFPVFKRSGHECHGGRHIRPAAPSSSSGSLRY